jgi:hypothetical protein
MKTLISKLTKLLPLERKVVTKNYTVCTFFFIILFPPCGICLCRAPLCYGSSPYSSTFIFSSSSSAMQTSANKNDETKGKRYAILEKLEKGTSLSSEEIRSSFGDFTFNLSDENDHFIFHSHDFYFIPPFPPIPSFHEHYYYRHHDDDDHIIITDKDIKEIHRHLNESLEELKNDIESFRNSDEFLKIHDELQKWNERFRRELDKMKEELNESRKESKGKSSAHSYM